jgi:hypothetical protein
MDVIVGIGVCGDALVAGCRGTRCADHGAAYAKPVGTTPAAVPTRVTAATARTIQMLPERFSAIAGARR